MPPRTALPRRAARGFTLTELAIVLGVVGILLGAIWGAAAMVYDNNRATRAASQVTQIVSNFKGVYSAHGMDIADWTDITNMAILNNLLPSDMIVSGNTTTGTGPWPGSVVYIYSYKSANSVIIQYTSLTKAACNRLGNAAASGQPGLIWASIDSASAWFVVSGSTPTWTSTNIDSYCTSATANTIQVMYALGG